MNIKKLDLNEVAEEFEMIDLETRLFFNKETGEFDFYNDYMDSLDTEKFEDGAWIATLNQCDIGEYDMMVEFADTVTDTHKNDLLTVALEGKGAFRRFKDTLHRVDLADAWYNFKRKAFVELAKEWCEDNGIEYLDNEENNKPKLSQMSEDTNSEPIAESKLILGKTAAAKTTVKDDSTAIAVGSGNLDVFATPTMIALMEQAACECLANCLEEGQTSVGCSVNIEHLAASPLGAQITATATIEHVFGRKIEFTVNASDGCREIGKGRHTRMIVDAKQFMKKTIGNE